MLTLVILVAVLACFGLIAFIGAPYVPTHRRQIKQVFLEGYTITPEDLVVDLGSGDGVLLRAVAQRGGRALGIELNPILWALSLALRGRFRSQIKVLCANFWYVRLPEETTLVYAFADSRNMGRIYRKLTSHVKRTGKPLTFMSYGFELPNLTPTKRVGGMVLYSIQPAIAKSE